SGTSAAANRSSPSTTAPSNPPVVMETAVRALPIDEKAAIFPAPRRRRNRRLSASKSAGASSFDDCADDEELQLEDRRQSKEEREAVLIELPSTPRGVARRHQPRQDAATTTDSPRLLAVVAPTFASSASSASGGPPASLPGVADQPHQPPPPSPSPRPVSAAAVRVDLDDLRAAMREASGKFGRLPAHGVIIHCGGVRTACLAHSAVLPRLQTRLQRLRRLESRLLLLELRRKIAARMRDLTLLAEQIDRVRRQEERLLRRRRSVGSGGRRISSSIECVYGLCERLRASLSQLQQVRLFTQQSCVLQASLSEARPLLTAYQAAAGLELSRALASTRDLVRAGLRALASADLSRYSPDDLFQISRGIEEFNSVLELAKAHQRSLRVACRCSEFAEYAAPRLALEDLRPMSLTKILACLAAERSAVPTEMLHDFYCANRDLLRFLRSQTADGCSAILYGIDCGGGGERGRRNNFDDNQQDDDDDDYDDGEFTDEAHGAAKKQPGGGVGGGNKRSPGRHRTSDYYSDEVSSLHHQSERAERALSRFTDRLVRQGSPLAEFVQQETEFASGFLDCLAQSTKLLPRPQQQQILQQRADESPVTAAASGGSKKGVHWSDHSDVSLRHQVVARYLDLVWREADACFAYRIAKPMWPIEASPSKRLGSCRLMEPAAMQLLGYTVQFTATDALFPPRPASLLPFLHSVALRLHLQACHAMWEAGFSRFLGLAQRPDSAQPTLLASGPRCSRLGKAFLDCLRPCLKAIGLCIAELEAWVRGRRGVRQHQQQQQLQPQASGSPPDVQLEPYMAFLNHWLLTASLSCRVFLRAVGSIADTAAANDQPGVCAFLALTDLQFAEAELRSVGTAFKRLRRLPDRHVRLRARLAAFGAEATGAVAEKRASLLSSFAEQCRAKARRQLAEAGLPRGRHDWKLAPADVEQLRPRPYAQALVAACLEPAVKAVAPLSRQARLEGLGPPLAALAEAWSSAIVAGRPRLRVNFYGAKQMEADVEYLLDYLDSACGDRDLTDSLMALQPVRCLRAGVRLLKRQPAPAGAAAVRPSARRLVTCGGSSDAGVESNSARSIGGPEAKGDRDADCLINKQQWLALRTEGQRKFIAICG
ncbi:hypothetical protein BOX15_Mlig015507g1, partial [Macrostomum lignano]